VVGRQHPPGWRAAAFSCHENQPLRSQAMRMQYVQLRLLRARVPAGSLLRYRHKKCHPCIRQTTQASTFVPLLCRSVCVCPARVCACAPHHIHASRPQHACLPRCMSAQLAGSVLLALLIGGDWTCARAADDVRPASSERRGGGGGVSPSGQTRLSLSVAHHVRCVERDMGVPVLQDRVLCTAAAGWVRERCVFLCLSAHQHACILCIVVPPPHV
jgi:hypothetical protein